MCVHPINGYDNLDRPIEISKYQHELDNCDYFDLTDPIEVSHGDLLVMQLNIRGLFGKLSNLKDLVNRVSRGKKLTLYYFVRPGKTKIAQPSPFLVITMCIKVENIRWEVE